MAQYVKRLHYLGGTPVGAYLVVVRRRISGVGHGQAGSGKRNGADFQSEFAEDDVFRSQGRDMGLGDDFFYYVAGEKITCAPAG